MKTLCLAISIGIVATGCATYGTPSYEIKGGEMQKADYSPTYISAFCNVAQGLRMRVSMAEVPDKSVSDTWKKTVGVLKGKGEQFSATFIVYFDNTTKDRSFAVSDLKISMPGKTDLQPVAPASFSVAARKTGKSDKAEGSVSLLAKDKPIIVSGTLDGVPWEKHLTVKQETIDQYRTRTRMKGE